MGVYAASPWLNDLSLSPLPCTPSPLTPLPHPSTFSSSPPPPPAVPPPPPHLQPHSCTPSPIRFCLHMSYFLSSSFLFPLSSARSPDLLIPALPPPSPVLPILPYYFFNVPILSSMFISTRQVHYQLFSSLPSFSSSFPKTGLDFRPFLTLPRSAFALFFR